MFKKKVRSVAVAELKCFCARPIGISRAKQRRRSESPRHQFYRPSAAGLALIPQPALGGKDNR